MNCTICGKDPKPYTAYIASKPVCPTCAKSVYEDTPIERLELYTDIAHLRADYQAAGIKMSQMQADLEEAQRNYVRVQGELAAAREEVKQLRSGADHIADTRKKVNEMLTKDGVNTALEALKDLQRFAYDNGYHEHGYDPHEVASSALMNMGVTIDIIRRGESQRIINLSNRLEQANSELAKLQAEKNRTFAWGERQREEVKRLRSENEMMMREYGPELREVKSELTKLRALALPDISDRLASQDNRCTDHPMFCLQIKVRDIGYDANYADGNTVWIDMVGGEGEEVDPNTDGAEEFGYQDRWETVMVAFTEQGILDYMDLDGHNVKRRAYNGETRIYVESFRRCTEMIRIRLALLAAAGRGELV